MSPGQTGPESEVNAEEAQGEWFHRGPCHACATCRGDGCYVWNDSVNPEVHVCANGCDGTPPGLGRAA